MKYYICASTDDIKDVVVIANILKAHGNTITREWWNSLHGDKNQYAYEDLLAVKNCDGFLMFNGERKSSGKYIELGMAIAFNKPIFVINKQLTSIFRVFTTFIGDLI